MLAETRSTRRLAKHNDTKILLEYELRRCADGFDTGTGVRVVVRSSWPS